MIDLPQNQTKKEPVGLEVSSIPGLAFLNFLGDGVMVLDNTRKILMVNSVLENLLGWKASELVGQFCFSFLCSQHPATGTYLCQNLCPLMSLKAGLQHENLTWYQDLLVLTKSGQRIEVSASFAPLAASWVGSGGVFNDDEPLNPDLKGE